MALKVSYRVGRLETDRSVETSNPVPKHTFFLFPTHEDLCIKILPINTWYCCKGSQRKPDVKTAKYKILISGISLMDEKFRSR